MRQLRSPRQHADERGRAYLLLELLVDGIQCILDGHALKISCSDLEA